MPRADRLKTVIPTQTRASQQSDFPSSRRGMFEIQALSKNEACTVRCN